MKEFDLVSSLAQWEVLEFRFLRFCIMVRANALCARNGGVPKSGRARVNLGATIVEAAEHAEKKLRRRFLLRFLNAEVDPNDKNRLRFALTAVCAQKYLRQTAIVGEHRRAYEDVFEP